jgi:antitoxin YefM
MPRAITYSRVRAELMSVLDEVCDNHDVVYVARHKGGDVVILSREDYESLEETAHLLRSPANARRLEAALNCGGSEYVRVDLDELKQRLRADSATPKS